MEWDRAKMIAYQYGGKPVRVRSGVDESKTYKLTVLGACRTRTRTDEVSYVILTSIPFNSRMSMKITDIDPSDFESYFPLPVDPETRTYAVDDAGRISFIDKVPDFSNFPHTCPRCGARAYVGATPDALECTSTTNGTQFTSCLLTEFSAYDKLPWKDEE